MSIETRRKFLLGAGAAALSGAAVARECLLTPSQTEGPFYPISRRLDEDQDLTQIKGRTGKALGEVVIISGHVKDQNCQPVSGALVEIWQASHNGKYNHPSDPNPKPIDENFQYWGRAITNNEGRYDFKTIRPGAYPATPTWDRPPHIHFKIQLRGYEELTTQMYFAGDPLNAKDRILQSLSAAERRSVLVEFRKPAWDQDVKRGWFDITLRKL